MCPVLRLSPTHIRAVAEAIPHLARAVPVTALVSRRTDHRWQWRLIESTSSSRWGCHFRVSGTVIIKLQFKCECRHTQNIYRCLAALTNRVDRCRIIIPKGNPFTCIYMYLFLEAHLTTNHTHLDNILSECVHMHIYTYTYSL